MKFSTTILVLFCITAQLQAGEVNPDNMTTFSAGTTAVASEVNGNFAEQTSQIDDNHERIAQLEQTIVGLQNTINSLQTSLNNIANNSVLELDGNLQLVTDTNGYPTVQFTGVNVQVINGVDDETINGVGNLIVGYNLSDPNSPHICSDGKHTNAVNCTAVGETWGNNQKNGSHNLVVGHGNSYTNRYGVVFGSTNSINREYATITGGTLNRATGYISSVNGGYGNIASNTQSVVTGGIHNTASGLQSVVTGGEQNTASGVHSTVSGGLNHGATGPDDWRAGDLFQDQ